MEHDNKQHIIFDLAPRPSPDTCEQKAGIPALLLRKSTHYYYWHPRSAPLLRKTKGWHPRSAPPNNSNKRNKTHSTYSITTETYHTYN